MECVRAVSVFQHDYKYLGEGNCNVCVSLGCSGLILRLQKSERRRAPEDELSHLRRQAFFIDKVMRPLIGPEFVHAPQVVELVEAEVQQLEEQWKHTRPSHRLHRQLLCRYGLLLVDYTSPLLFRECVGGPRPVLCVEIKCKQGWVPPALATQYGRCTFCMHQYLKLERAKITSVSGYCPLDLFSGDEVRMTKALAALLWSPQNNLKVFVSGVPAYGEGGDLQSLAAVLAPMLVGANPLHGHRDALDALVELLLKGLLGVPQLKAHHPVGVHLHKQFHRTKSVCDASRHALPPSSVLRRVLDCQLMDEDVAVPTGRLSEYQYLVEMTEGAQPLEPRSALVGGLSSLQKYMLACTAKDCSIMLSFTRVSERRACGEGPGCSFTRLNGLGFLCKVGVVDLDAKPATKVNEHRERDRAMVRSFSSKSPGLWIQPHAETRHKQISAWRKLILEYFRANHLTTLDVQEMQQSKLFCNQSIQRQLSAEAILTVLEELERSGDAAPWDKSRGRWDVYWRSLEEWAALVYAWACNAGMNNTVCTLHELVQGDNTTDQEFYGLQEEFVVKVLRALERRNKCEVIAAEEGGGWGVKFF